jgi:hypothetical protein
MKKGVLIGIIVGVVLFIIVILGIFFLVNSKLNKMNASFSDTQKIQNIHISPSEQTALDKCDSMQENGIYTSERYDCYIKVATDNKNPLICEKFVAEDHAEECRLYQPGNNLCAEELTNRTKADCYLSIGPATEESSYCTKSISLGHNKYNVYYECYSKIAESKKDLSPCDLINDNLYRASCYMGVAVAKKDYTLCGNVATIYFLSANKCYTDVAVALNDSSICEKIIPNSLSSNDKEDCYKAVLAVSK